MCKLREQENPRVGPQGTTVLILEAPVLCMSWDVCPPNKERCCEIHNLELRGSIDAFEDHFS